MTCEAMFRSYNRTVKTNLASLKLQSICLRIVAKIPTKISLKRLLTSVVAVVFLGGMAAALPAVSQSPARPSPLPRIEVAADGHLLQTEDGRPFFWLGDTAWELIHHTTREEASYYLHTRARQGFNVIQTVVLSEFDGVMQPSAWGERPLLDNDIERPNPAYFDRVVELIDEAAADGLYVALVPIWGDKLTAPWGTGPRLFRKDNLPQTRTFARLLAHRLRDRTNVIWVLGGDRPASVAGEENYSQKAVAAGFSPDTDWRPIWRAVAAGIADESAGKPVILYHPQGGEASSSVYLHNEPWLSINGMQSGHGGGHDMPVWDWVARDYALKPAKPTLDLEPNYEDHPVSPWPEWDPAKGYFRDLDVRKQVYRSVFAGACGVTYGHHAVWGFINERNHPVTYADMGWIEGMERPGGRQMHALRELIESRPFFHRIPDQTMIVGDSGKGSLHVQATRDSEGSYAFVYLPTSDQTVTLDLTRLRSSKGLKAWWYDPRTGIGTLIGMVPVQPRRDFRSPSYGPDWVLVLDDPEAHFSPPGLPSRAASDRQSGTSR